MSSLPFGYVCSMLERCTHSPDLASSQRGSDARRTAIRALKLRSLTCPTKHKQLAIRDQVLASVL